MDHDVDYMAARIGVAYLDAWRARDTAGNKSSASVLDEVLRRRAVPHVWLEPGRPRDVLLKHWADNVEPSQIRALLLAEVPEACSEIVRAQLISGARDTAAREAEEAALRPTFVGFFDRDGSPSASPDVEDFYTTGGHHFDLIDLGLECTHLEFQPSTRTLVNVFEGAETDTLPHQIATFTFEAALIYQWDDVHDRPQREVPEPVHGFSYDGRGCFSLLLHDQWISWVATSVNYDIDLGAEHEASSAHADVPANA